MRPYELRPPVRGFGLVSDFSGLSRVISEKSETVWNRRPGLVGLRLRRGIRSAFEQIDLLAGGEGDDGPLGVGPLSVGERAPVALALAVAVHGVHLFDPHVEDRLDGLADLGAVGVRVDDEGVNARVEQGVGLLRHDRADDDVAGVLHDCSSSSLATATSASAPAGAAGTGSAAGSAAGAAAAT